MTSFPSISVAVKSKIEVGEAAWNEKLISFNQFPSLHAEIFEILLDGVQKLKTSKLGPHLSFKLTSNGAYFLENLLCGAYKGGAYKTRLREHSISSNFTTNLTSIVPLVITSVVAQHYKLKHIQIQLIGQIKRILGRNFCFLYCYCFQEFSPRI